MINTKKEPYENCKHFNTCAVNKCPLHPDYEHLDNFPGDEKVCRATKAHRTMVFNQCKKTYPLSNLGLKKREFANMRKSTLMKQLVKINTEQFNNVNKQPPKEGYSA